MSAPDPLVAELRTLRLMLGIRATDIADSTGLNLASISNWENGRTAPRVEKLRPYAAAIGFELTLTPTDEADSRVALVAEHHLPLLDLTADEIRALIVAAAMAADDSDDPDLHAALDKYVPPPADTTPGRPHHDEPALDRPVTTVHLPAADIA